ncbi:MAG: D-alanine--D-alanine ligase [Sphingobacteriales bacterium]|nr:MAG: D-alanine--D-alanine ligase [Sphingobacteriales bacterium]
MKKNIALVAGGYSGESVISLRTAQTIRRNLDPERYNVYPIVITRQSWYYAPNGEASGIEVDKNDFSLVLPEGNINFDAAFIAVHGTPGEDGRLQGYFDMIGLPYSTCTAIVSALTFNKKFCNSVVKDFGVVDIAKSVHLTSAYPYNIGAILEMVKLPVFVKPAEGGSSLGTSKVKEVSELLPAINLAFNEDNQVLIEEFIEGRELTIGVYRIGDTIHVLPPTEIKSSKEFFDYEAKYTQGVTEEITPAQVTPSVLAELDKKAAYLYQHLNCRGVVRIDFILQRDTEKLFFLEVNTMPGQSEASIIPQQVRASGMELTKFYGALVEQMLSGTA